MYAGVKNARERRERAAPPSPPSAWADGLAITDPGSGGQQQRGGAARS